jgi:hypothetical protein
MPSGGPDSFQVGQSRIDILRTLDSHHYIRVGAVINPVVAIPTINSRPNKSKCASVELTCFQQVENRTVMLHDQ